MPVDRTLNPWVSGLPDPTLVPQFKGDWQAVSYGVANVVLYNRSLYVATQATLKGEVPGISTKWKLLFDGTIVDTIPSTAAYNKIIGTLYGTKAQLSTKGVIDGKQLADNDEWVWDAVGTPDNAYVIAASDGGVWKRVIKNSVKLSNFAINYTPLATGNLPLFQTALALAVANNVPLELPAQAFDIVPLATTNPPYIVNIPSNAQITGVAGKSTIRLVRTDLASPHNPRLYVTGSQITLKDFKISEVTHNGTPLNRVGYNAPLTFEGASNCVVTNVEISGSSGTGIHVLNTSHINFTKCYVHNTMADGIHCSYGTKNVHIEGCTIQDNDDDCIGIVSHGVGIPGFDVVQNVTLANNILGDTKQVSAAVPGQTINQIGSGVAIVGAFNVTVTGNVVSNTATVGIRVTHLDEARNYVEPYSPVYAPAARVTVSGNTISNAGFTTFPGTVKDGIYVSGARDVTIIGNTVVNSKENGFLMTGPNVNIKVEGNLFSGGTGFGAYLTPTRYTDAFTRQIYTATKYATTRPDPGYVSFDNVIVKGNTFTDFDLGGFSLNSVAGQQITNLQLKDNEFINTTRIATGTPAVSIGYQDALIGPARVTGNTVLGSTNTYQWLDNNNIYIDSTNFPPKLPMTTPFGEGRFTQGGAMPANGSGKPGDFVFNYGGGPVLLWRREADGSWTTVNI